LTEYAKVMTDLGGNDTLEIDDRVGFVTEWGSGYYYLAAAGVTGFTNHGDSVTFTMNTPEAQSMIMMISNLLLDKFVTKIVVDSYNNDYTASGNEYTVNYRIDIKDNMTDAFISTKGTGEVKIQKTESGYVIVSNSFKAN
ncbi:MAG: hypothetical protein II377_01555, partial [Clostridia bacterium]|nr:hypothetical protein [Clostridia bacterium]